MLRVHSSDDKLIERTQKKLRKAQFFLGNLGHESRVPGNEHEAFDHYLSAFLSAARSVTFALQIKDKERYDRIFPKWQNNLANEDRDMLKHMNEQRVAEVHNKGAKTTVEWEMVPMIEVRGLGTVLAIPFGASMYTRCLEQNPIRSGVKFTILNLEARK